MNFSYSKGEEVMVNTKSLMMTAGGREPMKVCLFSILKEISLATTEFCER